MANLPVKVMRGIDFEDGQEVAVLQYRLPDNREGVAVISELTVMDVAIQIKDASNTQIMSRVSAYLSSRGFLIDMLNDQHFDANEPRTKEWLQSLEVIYEGDLYTFGIDGGD